MGERGEGSWIGFDASLVKLPRNRRLFIVRPGTSRINSTKMVGRPPHKKSSPARADLAAAGAALLDKRRNLMKTFCCCVRRPSAVARRPTDLQSHKPYTCQKLLTGIFWEID